MPNSLLSSLCTATDFFHSSGRGHGLAAQQPCRPLRANPTDSLCEPLFPDLSFHECRNALQSACYLNQLWLDFINLALKVERRLEDVTLNTK